MKCDWCKKVVCETTHRGGDWICTDCNHSSEEMKTTKPPAILFKGKGWSHGSGKL